MHLVVRLFGREFLVVQAGIDDPTEYAEPDEGALSLYEGD